MVWVAYECDRKKCGDKCTEKCRHTMDYDHAVNKDKIPDIRKTFDIKIDDNLNDIFITERIKKEK